MKLVAIQPWFLLAVLYALVNVIANTTNSFWFGKMFFQVKILGESWLFKTLLDEFVFFVSPQQFQIAYKQFIKKSIISIYFMSPVVCSLSLEVTAQPSFSPPTGGSLCLTIADQRRKHNAHIHAASAPFLCEEHKRGQCVPVDHTHLFLLSLAWIIWPERVTQRKASRHTHFAPNPNTAVSALLLHLHFYMYVLAGGPCVEDCGCVCVCVRGWLV